MDIDEETSYKCEYCELKLENYKLWSQHVFEQHNVTLVQCKHCNAELPSESELQLHIRNKHTIGRKRHFECSHCPSTLVSLKSLKEHLKINHKRSPPFSCRKCNRKYKTYYTLQYHLKMAHRPLSYIRCDQCSKLFYTKETLKRHKELHLESYQRAQCSMCPASYKHRGDLYRHIRKKHFHPDNDPVLHNEDSVLSMCESNNKCNICSITFPDEETLLSHRQVFHDGNTDIFSCEDCPALFKIREAYENHLLEEHGKHPEQHFDVDRKDLLFQEHVDFESAMVQNSELRQLMVIRKQRKFNQKIVIINYREEYDENTWTVEHDGLNETELNEINENVKTYFENLISHYRIDQMTEVRDFPIQICHNEPENEEINSEKNYLYLGTPYEQEQYFENDEGNNILDEIDELNVMSVKDTIEPTFYSVDETTQNENSSMMQCMPKMMFNCLECTDLFPDEDSLLNHLTTNHNKSIPVPKDIQDNDLPVTTEATKSRLLDETIKEVDQPKRKDAQYLTRENNKTFKERKRSRKMARKINRISASSTGITTEKSIMNNNKSRDKSLKHREKSKSKVSKRAKETMINHQAKTSNNFKMNKCNICHKSFKLKANLVQHMNYTHKKKMPKRKHAIVNLKETFVDNEENGKTETRSSSKTADIFVDSDGDIMNYTHKKKTPKRKHAKVNLKETLLDDEENGKTETRSSSKTADILVDINGDVMNYTHQKKKPKRKHAKMNIKEKFHDYEENSITGTLSTSTAAGIFEDVDEDVMNYTRKKKKPQRKHAKMKIKERFDDCEENSITETLSTSTAADIFEDIDEDVMNYTRKKKKPERTLAEVNVKEKFEDDENGKTESRSSSTAQTLLNSTTGDIFGNIDEDISLMFPCEHCQGLFPCIELLLNHCAWQHNYRSMIRY